MGHHSPGKSTDDQSNQNQQFKPQNKDRPPNTTKRPPPIPTQTQQNRHANNAPVNINDFPPLHGELRQDDTTVGTTASNLSRNAHSTNQNYYNSKFQEIDATIKQHQQEFHAIHTRFDSINDQLLRNMQIASDHSKQFTHLENQVNEMNEALKILLKRTEERKPAQQINPNHTNRFPTTIEPYTRNQQEHHNNPDNTDTHDQMNTENPGGSMSVASTSSQSRTSLESAPITSPEKKRIRQTTYTITDNPRNEQETSAQYNDSTPADPDL